MTNSKAVTMDTLNTTPYLTSIEERTEVPLIEDAIQTAYIRADGDIEDSLANHFDTVNFERQQYASKVLQHFWKKYSRNCKDAQSSDEEEVSEVSRFCPDKIVLVDRLRLFCRFFGVIYLFHVLNTL